MASTITRIPHFLPILTAKASNGVGATQLVNDFKNVLLEVYTSGVTTLTMKVQGSFQKADDPPDFSSAQSPTNRWFYIHAYELDDPLGGVAGGAGFTVTASTVYTGLSVNTDGIVWLNIEISGYAAGSITVTGIAYTNQ